VGADCPRLKTIEDALVLRSRMLLAFEPSASRTARQRRGSPSPSWAAVRQASSWQAPSRDRAAMTGDFRNFDPTSTRVILIDEAIACFRLISDLSQRTRSSSKIAASRS
jgi:hypothetical protein